MVCGGNRRASSPASAFEVIRSVFRHGLAARPPCVTARAVVALCVLLASAPDARAQAPAPDYRLTSWTTAQGLPQNSINDLVVLPNGELWIATFGGLARFDGVGFRVVDMASDARLPDNRVLALVPHGDDGFYFVTLRGHLGRIVGDRPETLVRSASGDFEALGLVVDRRGVAWTRSVNGYLYRATPGDRHWRTVAEGSGLTSGLHGIAETDDGELWASLGDRLVRVDGDAVVATVALPVAAHTLLPRQGGGLWVATERGLYRLEGTRLTRVATEPELDARVFAVAQESPDVLWVASRGSALRYTRQPDATWTGVPVPLTLPADHYVRTLRADGAGGAWVGTTGLGLHHLARLPVRRLAPSHDAIAVTALAADGRGGTYLAEWCSAVRYVGPDGRMRTLAKEGLLRKGSPEGWPCSVALAPAGAGKVWLRVEDGLALLDLEGRRQRHVGTARSATPGPIVPDGRGGLYVVSRDGTVESISSAGVHQRAWTLPPPLISAVRGPDDSLWVGGNGALFRLHQGTVAKVPGALPPADIRDVLVDEDGTVWVATYGGGLARWRNGTVTPITVAHGLPDNSLSALVRDSRDRLWMSTNRGLVVIDRPALTDVANGRQRRVSAVVLGPSRGVPEATFGLPAGIIDGRGIAWFGSISGAVAVDTTDFPRNPVAPRARLEQLYVDDRAVPIAPRVVVPPHTRRVRLELSSIGLGLPDQVTYRFRVEGMDDDWIETGPQRLVDWTPPSPGEHRLLVEARNEDGIWSTQPLALTLAVQPAWWQTVWARGGAVLGGVLLLVGGWRWRTRQIERRHAERVRVLKEQAAADRHIATLRSQLDHVSRVALAGELAATLAHEVSQPVAAMLNNAEAGRQQPAYYAQHPEELSALLGDIVTDGLRASDIIHGLRGFLRPQAAKVERLNLDDVVRDMLPLVQRELRDHRIELALHLAGDLPPVDGVRVQLGQVVINLALNGCEAMARVDGARRLEIRTHAEHGLVRLTVRDTGGGIDPLVTSHLFEPFVTTKAEGLGMGLTISRGIAEAHGGKLTASHVGDGTEFVLTLPANSREQHA